MSLRAPDNLQGMSSRGWRTSVIYTSLFLLCLPGCAGQTSSQAAPAKPILLQTEDYPKQIGYDVKDSASSGGQARVSFSKVGLLVWGQYLTLPPGKYVAAFRLKTGGLPAGTEPALALSVTSGGITNGGVTDNLALKTLDPAHLKPLYRDVTVPVTFTTEGSTDLEFRVQALRPELFVWSDYVMVTKAK